MSELHDIKDRLAKLLRLGEDSAASPGEIENAMQIANQLMARYQLTREDIDSDAIDPVEKVRIGRHFAFFKGSRTTTWESMLAHFVRRFIGSVAFYVEKGVPLRRNGVAMLDDDGRIRSGSILCFFGSDDDAECAVEMFEQLRDDIFRLAIVRWGSWAKGNGAAYAEAFCSGLEDARRTTLDAMRRSDPATTALVLRSEQHQLAIVDKGKAWLATTHGIHLVKGGRRTGSLTGSGEARRQGFRDGKAYNPSRPTVRPKIA